MEDKRREKRPACAACDVDKNEHLCRTDKGKGGRGCPTVTRRGVLEEANREYEVAEIREFAHSASVQEAECYANRQQKPYVLQPTKTRIVEICEFAKKMGYKRLGLAFCIGLAAEANIVEDILESHDFDVVSVACIAPVLSFTIIYCPLTLLRFKYMLDQFSSN